MIKEIPGYKGYTASDDGKVYGKSGVELKDVLKVNYVYVRVNGKNVRKHRLIALAFIPNPDNLPEVNHKDCNTQHNWASNLEWCTRSDNVIHEFNTGGLTTEHMSRIAKLSTGGKQTARLHSIPILQIDTDGNVINRFSGIREASRITGIQSSGITRCCKGQYHQYKGYIWRYEENE